MEWWGLEWGLKGMRGKKLETVNIDNFFFEEFAPKGNKWGHHLTRTVLEEWEGDSSAIMGLRGNGKGEEGES